MSIDINQTADEVRDLAQAAHEQERAWLESGPLVKELRLLQEAIRRSAEAGRYSVSIRVQYQVPGRRQLVLLRALKKHLVRRGFLVRTNHRDERCLHIYWND